MQVPSDFAAHAYSYICCICSCNAILLLLVSQVSPACVSLLSLIGDIDSENLLASNRQDVASLSQ